MDDRHGAQSFHLLLALFFFFFLFLFFDASDSADCAGEDFACGNGKPVCTAKRKKNRLAPSLHLTNHEATSYGP